MSYATNVARDVAENEYFVVFRPRWLVKRTEWTLVSSNIYSTPWTHGDIFSLTCPAYSFPGLVQTEIVFTEVGSLAAIVSNGEYFYDSANQILYFSTNSGIGISSANLPIVTYNVYVSTKEQIWYSDPTDTTTTQVKWNGCIKTPPSLSITSDIQNFGFFPFDPTNLVLNYDQDLFQPILYRSSFANIEVICWHQCGTKIPTNINTLLTGNIGGRVSISLTEVSFEITDTLLDLDTPMIMDIFDGTFSNLDPTYDGAPVRIAYGKVQGFVPVNVDYNANSPSTSNNRNWVLGDNTISWDTYSATIIAKISGTSLTISNADGAFFAVGDLIWVHKLSGVDEYTVITAVGTSGGHTLITLSGTTLGGTIIGSALKKSAARNVYLYDSAGPSIYTMVYGRDYTETTSLGLTTIGFTLNSNAESNAGGPTFDPNSHQVFCDVAGRQTITGGLATYFTSDKNENDSSAISNDATFRNTWGAFQRIAIVLYDFLHIQFGLSDVDLVGSTFEDLDGVCQNEVAFAIPRKASDSIPTYKDVLQILLASCNSRLFTNADGQVGVSFPQKISSSDQDILKEDMFNSTQLLDFTDVAVCNIKSNYREKSLDDGGVGTAVVTEAKFDESISGDQDPNNTLDVSNLVNFIRFNEISKSVDIETYLTSQDAGLWYNLLPTRVAYFFQRIYATRTGQITFSAKNELIQRIIQSRIGVTRDDLIGFSPGSDQARDFSIVKIEKGDSNVTIVLDDQAGIQES